MEDNSPETTEKLISSFIEVTSSSREVAISFLETHRWNLNAAVLTFIENDGEVATAAERNVSNHTSGERLRRNQTRYPNLRIKIPVSPSLLSESDDDDSSDYSPLKLVITKSPSHPSRFRNILKPTRSPTIKRRKIGSFDEAKEYYSEGEKSEMFVEYHEKAKDVVDKAMERPVESSRSECGETVSAEVQEQSHEVVTSNVTIWRNGFTIGDGPFKSLDDPENAAFLERIKSLESPRVLSPVYVQVKLIRREEDFTPPSMSLLVVDHATPTTSIQIRLADGTRFVTQFNTHHTVRDVRGFIDTSRPDGSKDYQLLIMGFPPTPLLDFDQTIEKAGIANSVLIQKL
ncbi:unnamed protein product [Arabidopsis halleri]